MTEKQCKIADLLREVVVPLHQFKLSTDEIDSEIVVFDGGDNTSPPIKPPDGLVWRSISINLLHVEDETDPNMGLTYPEIDGVNPFIRMPRQMSLNIIQACGLSKITNSLMACENLIIPTDSLFLNSLFASLISFIVT